MAGKQDFGAVGQGSASAEKVEVSEEFKVEEVPSFMPRSRHMLGKQSGDGQVKDLGKQNGDGEVTAAKRKADDSQVAAAGASSDNKAEKKWVEMPSEYMAWVLGQTREEGYIAEVATDEAWKEEFFAFQKWVGEKFEQNGRVMVPEDVCFPNPGGLQDLIDEAWEKAKRELEMTDECPPFMNSEEDTAVALPSN